MRMLFIDCGTKNGVSKQPRFSAQIFFATARIRPAKILKRRSAQRDFTSRPRILSQPTSRQENFVATRCATRAQFSEKCISCWRDSANRKTIPAAGRHAHIMLNASFHAPQIHRKAAPAKRKQEYGSDGILLLGSLAEKEIPHHRTVYEPKHRRFISSGYEPCVS